MKKIIIALITPLLLASCGLEKNEIITQEVNETSEKAIQVSSSIVPISSVINAIGGEYVNVNTIVPAGVSPHGFDLSAKNAVALENSELTFLIGLDQIDGFLRKTLENKKYVALADGIELIEAESHDHSDHEEDYLESHEDEHEHEEEHSDDEHEDEHVYEDQHDHSVDAHVWLGEENIYQIAGKIRTELIAIMPEQSATFIKNTEIFIEEVSNIYESFRVQHEGKTPREFIVFHDAYNYLIESVGIDTDLKIPFSENILQETGTAHMAELIEEIELHGVKNIFTEPQFSDGNLQKFAKQYNLVVSTLDPLGNDNSADGYIANLKSNLENISLIYE